ncbi:hypothetical protein N0V88_005980 [Collariella sp. IMI 366227]|nr:hypothetical protein N0V88_005980 [Collariella sp. IMI 366227]
MADVYTRISNAPNHEVCSVLASLCEGDSTIKKKAERMFAHIDRHGQAYQKQKLPQPKLYVFLNCKKSYDEARNSKDACNLGIDYNSEV